MLCKVGNKMSYSLRMTNHPWSGVLRVTWPVLIFWGYNISLKRLKL